MLINILLYYSSTSSVLLHSNGNWQPLPRPMPWGHCKLFMLSQWSGIRFHVRGPKEFQLYYTHFSIQSGFLRKTLSAVTDIICMRCIVRLTTDILQEQRHRTYQQRLIRYTAVRCPALHFVP